MHFSTILPGGIGGEPLSSLILCTVLSFWFLIGSVVFCGGGGGDEGRGIETAETVDASEKLPPPPVVPVEDARANRMATAIK